MAAGGSSRIEVSTLQPAEGTPSTSGVEGTPTYGSLLEPQQAAAPPGGAPLPADLTAAAAGASAAAPPAAPQPPAPPERTGSGVLEPLFVPIVVYMDETDHAIVAEEVLSHQGKAFEVAGGVNDAAAQRAALARMRQLQQYVCSHEAQGLPAVRLQYGQMSEALDAMHEYVLQCIKLAMANPLH